MSNLSQRSTVYFDPEIYQTLENRAASTQVSVSELIDEAVRLLINEEQRDTNAISSNADKEEISFESILHDLKEDGQI